MNLHWVDILTLAGYLTLIAWMGFYFSKKNTSTEQYFLGGRAFQGWVIGLSLVGTSISSITFLAFPADAFKTAWFRFIMNLALPLGIVIAAYVFLPFFRRGKITSAYEYLESRFGPSVRIYGAVTFLFSQCVRLSIILYLLSILIHELTGLNAGVSILVGGIFVGLYTVVGGINAVVWTDVIQTFVLVFGGILSLGTILYLMPGGLEQIFSVAIADGKLAFADLIDGQLQKVSWNLSLSSKTGTMMFLYGLTNWLTEYSGNQNTVQRYCAAKSMREARKGMVVAVFTSIPIWMFYMFLGTALYVFFKIYPTPEATEMLTGLRKAEQVLPFFIINYLPVGTVGIVIAAAVAAAMSSLDSSINAISTVGVVDIYRRHLVKNKDDQHYLKAAWGFASGASLFMIIGAYLLSQSEAKTLQDTATILSSITMGGILGLYLLGFLTRRVGVKSVWTGLILTFLFSLWTVLAGQKALLPEILHVPFDLYYTGIIGNVVMFAVGLVVSILITEKLGNLTQVSLSD
jgi:SSS family solute:Na+ symporter